MEEGNRTAVFLPETLESTIQTSLMLPDERSYFRQTGQGDFASRMVKIPVFGKSLKRIEAVDFLGRRDARKLIFSPL